MKKLTAMLLSLVMCLSLMTIPAQAGSTPIPDDPIIDGGPVVPGDPSDPGDKDPDEPGITIQGRETLPRERDEIPTD